MSETVSFLQRASDPGQYETGEADLSTDGSKQHFTRRMIWEAISPHLGDLEGRKVLDIGSGYGWLSHELSELGANPTGIDPSKKHVEAARSLYPKLDFVETTFEDYHPDKKYDLITATMTFEHFADLKQSLSRSRMLMNKLGRLVVLTGDMERYTMPRFGYSVDVQHTRDGEVAVRTDYGTRLGVIYDIFRTVDRFKQDAADAGLKTVVEQPYSVPDWVIEDYPRYNLFEGKPLFQVLGFEAA